MCEDTIQKTTQFLKDTIDEYGFRYLESDAYSIYKKLQEQILEPKYARCVLVSLEAQIPRMLKEEHLDKGRLIKSVEDICGFNIEMTESIAALYTNLFSEENQKEWYRNIERGFKEFCDNQWEFAWDGYTEWHASNVYMECSCTSKAIIQVEDPIVFEEDNAERIKQNPFITAKDLFKIYHSELNKKLSDNFEEYCLSDDYYPPVVEDYYEWYEELVQTFCDQHGLQLMHCEYEGETSDYLPNSYFAY